MTTNLTNITDYLLDQSWQIAILVVVVSVINLILRNRSAHIRYLLWMIVLAKCLLPPVHTVPLAILPEKEIPEPASISTYIEMSVPENAVPQVSRVESEKSPPPVTQMPTMPIVKELHPEITLYELAGICWVVGAGVLLIFNLLRALRANLWLWKQRKPLPVELWSNIKKLFAEHGVDYFPDIWLVDGFNQPFVWGLLRGSIYLPVDFLEINQPKHQKSVLGHELSHVIRFDAAVNTLQVVAQAIFWFHPLIWWANRKIRAEREKCCDEMAIAQLNTSPRDYSTAILETLAARHIPTRPVPSLAVAGPVKNIEERIKTMLRPGKKFHKRPSFLAATVVLLLALLTVPTVVVLSARAGENKNSSAKDEKPTESLHEAVRNGDIEQVRLNLARDIDIESKDPSGKTALHIAANKGHEEIARLLISKGADVNAKDTWNRHPLFYASLSGRKDVAEVLIANGAIVNAPVNEWGWTAIHVAARYGHKEIVELLLANGADANGGTTWISSPVELAMEGSHTEIVELLISKGADISPLHAALYMKDPARAKSLIEGGADVNKQTPSGATPLHIAVRAGLKDISKLLIDKGAEINATETRGRTPLHEAAERGQKDMVEMLLANRADVDAGAQYNRIAAEMAMGKGYTEIVELLIANGADISPLHFAIYREDGGKARRLIEGGADINKRTPYGTTPLHRAIDQGLRDIARLLIDRGANVNAKDNYNWTPLHSAAQRGYRDIVELLIAKGAYVSALDCNSNVPFWLAWCEGHKDTAELLAANGADSNTEIKWTPLHRAAEEGNINAAKRLIAEGANVNATASRDHTPLHIAARQGHKKMVELLLEHGAEVNAGAVYRITAAEMAMRKGHTEIVELLISKGADISPLHFAIYMKDEGKARSLIEGGADVNKRTPYGFTPLDRAVDRGLRDIVELLIDRGADVNAKDNWNWTPLHSAAYGRKDIAELLIARGANVNASDGGGWSPLYYALKEGHPQVAEVLRKHGAKE